MTSHHVPKPCDMCGRRVHRLSGRGLCVLCEDLVLQIPTGQWVHEALCAQVGGDMWFADGPCLELNMARAICAQCPVRETCLRYAVENGIEHGLWGGLTPVERRPLRTAYKEETEGAA